MYTRRPALPSRSFLLLGPRATGKTTWLRATLPEAQWPGRRDAGHPVSFDYVWGGARVDDNSLMLRVVTCC